MEDILKIATHELGIREIEGPQHSEGVLKYAREAGFSWINDDETPWCSIFMNWVAIKAGYVHSKRANARSWLNVGISVQNPEPGDVAVFWRESLDSHLGHVGIFLGFSMDNSRIYILGGNQQNSVSISAYTTDKLLDFRRLVKAGAVETPTGVLKRGDKGPQVVKLQDALKMAGFNCGTSDGIFGQNTEAAVKELQTTNDELEVNGIYNEKTKDYLNELLEDLG
jgi:uncharacterized protein (TIGR02594 family)